jgi:hypothetical protein
MDDAMMNDVFVELSSTFQTEFVKKITAYIRDEKKQKRIWTRFKRWLGSIRHVSCLCGPTGVGCECDRDEPTPMPPQRLPVQQSVSHLPLVIPPASALTQVTEI